MNKDTPLTLGQYIRAKRHAAGYSVRGLAAKVRIDFSYLAKVESGIKTNPSAEVLQRLADALGINSTELLDFIGVHPPMPEPRLYFRRKFGMTEADADVLAGLVEEFRLRQPPTKTERGTHEPKPSTN